jgi:ribosomal protein L29
MAILRAKDIFKLSTKDIDEKIKELTSELIKARASGKKTGKINTREIKRTIARLLTIKQINIKNKTMEAKK